MHNLHVMSIFINSIVFIFEDTSNDIDLVVIEGECVSSAKKRHFLILEDGNTSLSKVLQ